MRSLRTSLDVWTDHKALTKHSTISTDMDSLQTTLSRLQFKSDSPSMWIPEWNEFSDNFSRPSGKEFNCFCPFCGNFIKSRDDAMGCSFKKVGKIYLAHLGCLKDSSHSLSQNLEDLLEVNISYQISPKKPRILALGEKQFLVNIQIMHPLSHFAYFKGSKKLIFNAKSLIWEMNCQTSSLMSFQPNMVCLPVTEFKLVVSFQDISTNQNSKQSTRILIDLSNIQQDKEIVTFSVQTFNADIKGQFSIYKSQTQKDEIIQAMNYKYRFPVELPQNIVRINKLEIVVKKPYESDSQSSNEITQYSEFPIQNCLKPERVQWGYSSMTSEELNPEIEAKTSDRMTESAEQSTQTSYLKNRKELKEYVCSHGGSKEFQKTIQHMRPEQVDTIIQTLYYDFPQLIVHEYANYMFQSLIIVCSLQQRLKILEILRQNLSYLSSTKQGTFSLQQFIQFFTHHEQFMSVCSAIESQFIQLSMDENGTHFIRKLVKSFPCQFLVNFANQSADIFIQMVVDKNAICVIKAFFHVMRKIGENSSLIESKKRMIKQMAINLDRIIKDQFGNYIVQEGYEVFGEAWLWEVSCMMVQNFAHYSSEKYASNVILKCVKDYWRDPTVYDMLRQNLRNNDIISMFKNREGNRILLEIVEKWGEMPLKEKIQGVVLRQEASRYNSHKWTNSTRRSRTGTVGTNFKSFSDAIRPQESTYMRKKNQKGRKLH